MPSRSCISGVAYELQGDMLVSAALCVTANVRRRAVDIVFGVASPESHMGAGVVFAQPWCALRLCSKTFTLALFFLQLRPVVDMGNGVRRLRFHSESLVELMSVRPVAQMFLTIADYVLQELPLVGYHHITVLHRVQFHLNGKQVPFNLKIT
jgi:hypothetical protein